MWDNQWWDKHYLDIEDKFIYPLFYYFFHHYFTIEIGMNGNDSIILSWFKNKEKMSICVRHVVSLKEEE